MNLIGDFHSRVERSINIVRRTRGHSITHDLLEEGVRDFYGRDCGNNYLMFVGNVEEMEGGKKPIPFWIRLYFSNFRDDAFTC